MASALLRRRGNLGFGFGNDAQGFCISLFAVAGLLPLLLTARQLLLSAGYVDLLGFERVTGQNRNPVRQHLGKSPTDVVTSHALRAVRSAVQGYVARAQLGHQRRAPGERL